MKHVAFAGAPVHVSVAVPLVSALELSKSGNVALRPFCTVRAVLPSGLSEKSSPLPLRDSVFGEFAALSVIVRVPDRSPPADGAKVIGMVQVPEGARLVPHVPPGAMAKSPLVAMLPMLSDWPPLLVNVTTCGAEMTPRATGGKLGITEGESDTPGGAIPYPARLTC